MIETLEKLCGIFAPSGDEGELTDYLIKRLSGKCELNVDPLGNLIARVRGKERAKRRIMIDAHQDEVGIIATRVRDDGLVAFSTIGGINAECLLSKRFVFKNGVLGVIGQKPVHLCDKSERAKLPPVESLLLDIGARDKAEAESFIKPGDCAVFSQPFVRTGGSVISRAIDDRAGVAVLLKLIESDPLYDFYAVFSTREEVGAMGAAAAAYSIDPEICLCLEATTANDLPGVPEEKRVCTVGGGPAVSFMDHGTLYDKELFDLAVSSGIAQVKAAVAGGNNSGTIHRARGGIKTAALSVPCRYIHSAGCLASVSDIERLFDLVKFMLERVGG